MCRVLFRILFCMGLFHSTLQNCPEEMTFSGGVNLIWHQTPWRANQVESEPLCYLNNTLVTRNCSDSRWTPSLNETATCSRVVQSYYDLLECPQGFHRISADNSNYCYKIDNASAWNHPCFSSGNSLLITELSSNETAYLINSLKALNMSRYYWLPAQRPKLFHPLVWTIPGPNWGRSIITSQYLNMPASLSKNCLSLDIEEGSLVTKYCTEIYPSLCFHMHDFPFTGRCPNGFYYYKYMAYEGSCYDIVTADTSKGLTFREFQNSSCQTPLLNNSAVIRFIFKKIAQLNRLPENTWCWLKRSPHSFDFDDSISSGVQNFEGIINNAGVIGLMNSSLSLPCMACETEGVYGTTELMFEYNNEHNLIYLTVYYQSGLWKYSKDDIGIRCFSNANGFSRIIDVNAVPLIEITPLQRDSDKFEKVVYIINLVANTSAQYWCEGHTNKFTFITTDKIVVNPKGNETHVFSLVIKYYIPIDEVESMNNLSALTNNIGYLFKATQVLLMEVLSYSLDHMLILFHLHVAVDDTLEDKAVNIQETFDKLTNIAETKLVEFNCTFVNISSSVYCLPTTSMDNNTLDWELTPVGHISAPSQFCLRSNGLPVKRHCEGSYTMGATWGVIEGHCDNTYEPSETTVLLYGFVNGRNTYDNNRSQFVTEGLSTVLKDTDIIIPADIYYLSMSLQQISDIAQANETVIDTNIEHIAWVMDRVMILDDKYLRLAQTLNSTNVIVDSISDIIESITKQNRFNESAELSTSGYQIAVEPKFIVQITYPGLNNITGIAVVKDTSSEHFTDMSIQPLYKNTTIDEVLAIKNLEIATWLPSNLINSIQMLNDTNDETDASNNLHITITIYHNNAVFQELHENDHMINSRIIGITIPGYISNLEYAVPIIFKQMNQTVDPFCGYWDFEPQLVTHYPGSWKKQGCFTAQSFGDVRVCKCYHLTHFGYLFFTPTYPTDDNYSKYITHSIALNVITLVGSFLSLLGIVGIWITALIFGNWRKKAGTKVLLQLSTSIALPLIFMIIFNLDCSIFVKEDELYTIAPYMKIQCIVLGAQLHFSILASFMWMLITAVLQFIRYVRVLGVRRPARFMLKFTLIGWGTPLIPVIITLTLDPHTYIPASSTVKKICYPSGPYLIGAVLVPICLILLINVVLFLLVLHAISRGSDSKTKSTDMDLIGAQLRVSVFLFFLLGLTWLFGIFSFSNILIWSYLFCLTSTLQGLVLFIYFVICDPNTRGLWVTLMKPQFNTSSSRNSITSISTG